MSVIADLGPEEVPFVCLYDQLSRAFSSLQVQGMKSVPHEDDEFNNDFSVDPLADPRLDKMDLYNMVSSNQRDEIMNAQPSFNVGDSDLLPAAAASSESTSDSGSGE